MPADSTNRITRMGLSTEIQPVEKGQAIFSRERVCLKSGYPSSRADSMEGAVEVPLSRHIHEPWMGLNTTPNM